MKLAVFGDSWPVGTELQSHEVAFGDLLHERLNTKNFFNWENGNVIKVKTHVNIMGRKCPNGGTDGIRGRPWRDYRGVFS